jgi:hypothetical protein
VSDVIPRHFLEPLSVAAARPVFVVNVDADLLADRTAHIELHRAGVSDEVRGDMDLHAVLP